MSIGDLRRKPKKKTVQQRLHQRAGAKTILEHVTYGDSDSVVLRAKGQTVDAAPRVGRNDPCPCGSGKKSKRCCA